MADRKCSGRKTVTDIILTNRIGAITESTVADLQEQKVTCPKVSCQSVRKLKKVPLFTHEIHVHTPEMNAASTSTH